MKVLLVCGYRRTGKDYLYNLLSGKQVESRFRWKIYKNGERLNMSLGSIDIEYQRTSFADLLKSEASTEYGIPPIVPDSDKEVKQFIHYKTGKVVSARDIYIEWGQVRRSQDADYWCKNAFNQIKNKAVCVVTDWRFRNESEYVMKNFDEVITIRVYRSDVLEPDINIDSEHNLDSYQTDILLVRDDVEGEFEKAAIRFPQYQRYIASGLI
jgi:hypothetical protein